MSSDESSSDNDTPECILKCSEPKQLYKFPNKPVMKSVWLFKLGLDGDDFYPNPQVCANHFSKKMFNTDGRLKVIAVPDINLPAESTSKKIYKDDKKATIVSIKPRPRQKELKSIEFSSSSPSKPHSSQTDGSSSSEPDIDGAVRSWMNDNPEILVDYQLKVGGKHMCDVVEIPQYIVVFTVIKAKQKAPPKPGKPIEFLTIDEVTGDILETTSAAESVMAKPLKVLKPDKPSAITNQVQKNLPSRDPLTQNLSPSKPFKPIETFDITAPKLRPPPPPPPPPKPEIDIVFYTTKGPPTRDRSVQVDFSRKRKETSIQCDVEFDTDIGLIPVTKELYSMKACFNVQNNSVSSGIEECILCGEILESYASKVKHARTHKISPSLCSQCGEMFDNQMELKVHEKRFHFSQMVLAKPQRCPKVNCNKAFRSLKQLNNHIEEHIRTREHQCIKCAQTFNSAMKLICHQRALDSCLRTRGWTSRRWSRRI